MSVLGEAPCAVEARAVQFAHFGGQDFAAFASLELTLRQGELLCLAGVNGSGKSTLLALLAGLYVCRAGCLRVFGHDMTQEPSRLRGAACAALLMQDPDVQILGATAGEDLLLGTKGDAPAQARAMALAGRFLLSDVLDTPCQHLSYGQKRKLCLAAALMREPRLLLLDEPFGGLDYPAVGELRQILLDLKGEGRCIIVSSHDMDPLLGVMDSILYLPRSGKALFGPVAAMLPHAAEMGVKPVIR